VDKQPIIKLENISHSFGERKILHNFNLSIDSGGKYIFTASSGFGKSTIFNMIMGFLAPDSGKVFIDDIEINDKNAPTIRNIISYLPQDISLPNLYVNEFIDQVISFSQNKFSMDHFKRWVNEVELPENILASRLFSLSGGEKQRLLLCICLSLNKKILLIDEGLTGLDEPRATKVLSLLSENKALTVIYISHDTTHAKISGFKKLEVS
jgi:ABC-type multidrug transport system ATPase subunit